MVIDKARPGLAEDDLGILARSSFCLPATSGRRGTRDVSPRGGRPGSAPVLGPRTIALPGRPGNRRGDSFRNTLENPQAGLLHLVPGGREVLRINGHARLLTNAPFFDDMTVDGRRPALAVLLEADEVCLHCPQSLRRSGVRDPTTWHALAAG
ncbi:pyridoxamine 5'-phosphate oxidase family protein [Streptomyces sp. KMM 9044]|uniref:pyridoxamine 5'-phosphate oxidase family protein n=1 Tax=Streptomyces sp. KMM 9044 TaxID=2744474 RepID=UPI002F3E4B20